MDFSDLMIGSIAVIPVVLGLVQFAKKFGLDGNGNIVLALLLGVAFGGLGYAMNQELIPDPAMPWIELAVYALAVGLSAAGLYDLGKTRFGTQ